MSKIQPKNRRGQSLVEFAVVALASYVLLAGILTFGYLFYAGQGIQQAVDFAAREISHTSLPANSLQLEELLGNQPLSTQTSTDPVALQAVNDFRKSVFDYRYLVLFQDVSKQDPNISTLQELIPELPLVNQQLVPLMIADQIDGQGVLRYPGAVFKDPNTPDSSVSPTPSGYLVAIPLVISRDINNGAETITWVPVLESIKKETATVTDPFKVSSTERGLVALRINYPFQAAAMSSFDAADPASNQGNVITIHVANDVGVQVVNQSGFTPPGTSVTSDSTYGTYSGIYGLGSQPQTVGGTHRPFRKLLSAQAIYRREVFQ